MENWEYKSARLMDLALKTRITPISAVHLNRKPQEKIMAWLSLSPASQAISFSLCGHLERKGRQTRRQPKLRASDHILLHRWGKPVLDEICTISPLCRRPCTSCSPTRCSCCRTTCRRPSTCSCCSCCRTTCCQPTDYWFLLPDSSLPVLYLILLLPLSDLASLFVA